MKASDQNKIQTTRNSRDIKATPEEIYKAFITPEALEFFQAPGEMKGKVHYMDPRLGGGYQMSLYYPDSERESRGKTNDKEDKFTIRFIEMVPDEKIIEAVKFDSTDPDFAGEMIIEISFEPIEIGTRVTFQFRNIPRGIKPEDNEAGTISTLEKLDEYMSRKRNGEVNI